MMVILLMTIKMVKVFIPGHPAGSMMAPLLKVKNKVEAP